MTEIAQELPVSRPAVSQHLRVLLEARLVDVRQEGRQRLYQVRSEGLEQLRHELESYWTQTLTAFKEVAEREYQATATTTEGGHVP